MEQREETSFTCVVEDVTTGTMTGKAGVSLYEYHTPSRPFSPLLRTLVEYFEVDYGESFTYEFNAKRGIGYTYVLEFDKMNGKYGQGGVNPDTYEPFYEINYQCTLDKKSSNTCKLLIEPNADVRFLAENPLDVAAQPSDSIFWILQNEDAFHRYSCAGIGGCGSGGGKIAHGHYDWHYQVYRDGVLEEDVQKQVYIKHNSDTTLWVWF